MPHERWASSPAVRASMQANKGHDSQLELRIRRALHRTGLRYRVNYRVPGMQRRTIDIAFPAQRLAIFVDGCYWHGCRLHRTIPLTNGDFWRDKITKNGMRDLETSRHLEQIGWRPMRFWEHEETADVASAIVAAIAEARTRASFGLPARRTGSVVALR